MTNNYNHEPMLPHPALTDEKGEPLDPNECGECGEVHNSRRWSDGSCNHDHWDSSGTCLGCGYNAGDYAEEAN